MENNTEIPRHVAIIMDGNGRWARSRGLDRLEGHIQGVESVREVIRSCVRRGVRFLTLYVFSTENWGRPQNEVDGLMELFCRCVMNETDQLIAQGVRVCVLGQRDTMPPAVKEHLHHIEQSTAPGEALTLQLAINYGSREEIANAVRALARDVNQGKLEENNISASVIGAYLSTNGVPDPDLVIRTSGECRLSNFLLWQSAYAELYFTDVLWPDFGAAHFDAALEEYARRERRYGLV